ncbi:antiterminator Q family protein [Marinobacter koreensis]|uniref:Antiterminator Q family protein n=1 Tax=Marinobacter koreensis TaxID=335974 RepID=A0ABW0RHZ4_9GAMM|nr:antiterminator Q family protein [Marinobacter koreensis]MCK7547176.1 hypothetical protein [Marinobacter koreensis]
MLSDTQQRLTEWARWVRTSDSGLRMGYNRVNLMPAGSVAMPVCTDEEALAVDRAIARLRRRDKDMADILVMVYSYGFSMARVARESGVGSRERVRYLLGGAEAWIDCALADDKMISNKQY